MHSAAKLRIESNPVYQISPTAIFIIKKSAKIGVGGRGGAYKLLELKGSSISFLKTNMRTPSKSGSTSLYVDQARGPSSRAQLVVQVGDPITIS